MSENRREPDVTVAIPARNASETLGRCLEAVLALQLPPARVVVLDDRSSDATAEIAKAKGVDVVTVPDGGGLGRARNLGLAECRTRFLAFLNADCYPHNDWLAVLKEVLLATGSAAAGGRQIELRRGTLAERWKAVHLRQDLGAQRLLAPDYLSGGNLLLDMAQVRGTMFDIHYLTAYEDVAFCRGLRASDRRLVYEPMAMVGHDHRETMRTLPGKVWSYGVHSRAVGPVPGLRHVPRAFVRMHRRPNDQIRQALVADMRAVRLPYLPIDIYLLCASFVFFARLARTHPLSPPERDTAPPAEKGSDL